MSLDPVKVKDTKSWFDKASHDIRAAELLLPAGLMDEVAFHCQQAVEKCLKGYLFWNNQPFKKTHDLNVLSSDCTSFDGSLSKTLASIAHLTQYAVEYRYPGPLMHPTAADAQDMIELAKKLHYEIASRLPFPIT